MLTAQELETARVIFNLLRGATSLSVVRDFLRSKRLAISAPNWDEMYARRIEPALNEGTLSVSELRDLLREVEECGRQHIFLYQCDPARAVLMLSPQRVQSVVNEMGLSHLFTAPLDLDMPNEPQIVDIRGIAATVAEPSPSLIIKQVETRSTNTFLRIEVDEQNNQLSRVYSVIKKRAINLARLYDSGLLEIRIASQDNSTRYHENISSFFEAISPLILRGEFKEISLSKAKSRLLDEQADLNGQVRYGHSEAINDWGFRMNVSTSSQEDDIFADDGSKEGLQIFLKNGGQVSRANVYFLIPDTDPQREVHVLLSGEFHEFAVPASCSAGDYQYVCAKIRYFNS